MSKTATGFPLPHCLAPVGGGGGYLLTGLFSVNRSFQTFCGPRFPGSSDPGFPGIWPQKSSRAAEGLPSSPWRFDWRLGTYSSGTENQAPCGRRPRFPLGVCPAEAAI